MGGFTGRSLRTLPSKRSLPALVAAVTVAGFQKLIASVPKSGSTSLAVRAAILMSPRIFLCRREQADPPFDLGRKHFGP